MTPQSKVIWSEVNDEKTIYRSASDASLCLLNLRASIDFNRERKKKQLKT